MVTKSKKPSGKKLVSKPAMAVPAEIKERKPRKPPLERAVKLASVFAKKYPALQKNVSAWKGEPTAEQRMAQVRIVNNLKKVAPLVDQLVSDLVFLEQSGYTPKIEHLGGRAKSFPPGTAVALKAKRYDAVIHGAVNAFAVVDETEKYFRIQAVAKGSPILGVPRGWLEKVANGVAPAVAVEGLDDEDENSGLSPED
jgi:hypothetical protein